TAALRPETGMSKRARARLIAGLLDVSARHESPCDTSEFAEPELRAAALALAGCGADTVLVNRDPRRGRAVAELLGFEFTPLDEFRADGYSLLVHATPVTGRVPFRPAELPDDAVVVDMVYAPEETAVSAAARERGLAVIDGWDVLLADAGCQFRLMTGQHIPTEQTRALLRAARKARRSPHR
ncbi:MAG: hypothetical protein IJH84_23180, partial [Saccharopolyspora sp.]|uniref:shikimate dehydrogenase family protein n=1 Tax=Saccharopolyspora sp. TaxID=33915 RepID=UPI00345DB2C3|nr:hypothetical protein [Saccharopolyspora sp.]